MPPRLVKSECVQVLLGKDCSNGWLACDRKERKYQKGESPAEAVLNIKDLGRGNYLEKAVKRTDS